MARRCQRVYLPNVSRRALALCTLASIALYGARANACASCSCGDQTLTAFGVEKPYRNRLRFSMEERYGEIRYGDMTDGAVNRTLRSAISVSWTPERHITLALMLPWLSSFISPFAKSPMQEIEGLGDLEVSARVLVFRDRSFSPRHLLWLTGGLKMPTGPEQMNGHYPVEDDLQPGSGSWDPFAGVTYGYFSGGLFSAFASASYRYTTSGRNGFRFGSAFGASLIGQVQPWWWGAFQAGFDVRWSAADQLKNGNDSPDSGGTIVSITPALLFSPIKNGNLLIRAAGGIPFAQKLNGTQYVGPQATLSVAVDIL